MSKNRDNVTWQSQDGRWNIGFFTFYEVGNPMDPDFDPEWDVEYVGDSFWFASSGHQSPESAYEAYNRRYGNPGGTTVIPFSVSSEALCRQYDGMRDQLNGGRDDSLNGCERGLPEPSGGIVGPCRYCLV